MYAIIARQKNRNSLVRRVEDRDNALTTARLLSEGRCLEILRRNKGGNMVPRVSCSPIEHIRVCTDDTEIARYRNGKIVTTQRRF